jgi:hypothetical protein
MSEEYKCKDCKWLTGRKNIRGIECMNPVLQEKWNGAKTLWMGELRKDTARYKQRNAPACKKFEAKESEHMGRYIDAKAAIARIAGQMSYEIEVETGNETDCVDLAEELLNDIPSIDIVRCKECKWRGIPTACPIDNFYAQRWTKDDDFCSYGCREEE